MMDIIDLRSDTVTQPTLEMREAMAHARVGDDVYGEDETVNDLQELAARRMGMEAGLFVPSGTMGNLAGILAHCGRGDEVILGNKAHTFLFEAGGISVLGGVHSYQVPNQPDGSLSLEDIEAAIRPDDPHDPVTRLVCLENTHNRCGGTYQTPEYISRVSDFVHKKGLSIHIDGARVFNAAVAQDVDVKELTRSVDSITFCLSKGLCAPVGSVLCGSREFIKKAHRIRKMLGGGMRQAGILAAAGIIAIEQMSLRLKEDHIRARGLASGLMQQKGLSLVLPATNMVFVDLDEFLPHSAAEYADRLKQLGVLVGVTGKRTFRLVVHYWIDDLAIMRTLDTFKQVLQSDLV